MVILFLLISIDLAELQKSLAKLGNPWVAGETSVSRLTDEEKANLMGSLTPYLFELEATGFQESYSDTYSPKSPSEWNWRNHKGKNWMTPVKGQEGCGSCYLFATVGGFEARLKIANNLPDTNIDLSEEFVLSCCNKDYGCHGGNLPPTAQFVVEIGVPDEKCFPYIGKVLPCINACPNVEARVTKAKRWGATNSVAQFKAKIMQGPMACWLTPKSDFLYYKGGVYTPIRGEKYVHAVTLCGWSDSLGAWLFKNSWTTDWGDSGYGWVNYGEERLIGPAYLTWLEIDTSKLDDDHLSSVICHLSSVHSVTIKFKVLKAGNITINVYDLSGKQVQLLVDDERFQPGDYEIKWNGMNNIGKRVAPGVYFCIIAEARASKLERNRNPVPVGQIKKLILL